MTQPRNIYEILKAYKRYPYGTPELPHITGDEAKQAISGMVDVVIGEDDTKDFNNIGRNNLRAEQRERKREAGL